MTWQITQSSGTEYGVMEDSYNEPAKEVMLDPVTYCDYSTGTDYSLRVHLEGNTETHKFDLKLMKYNYDGFNLSLREAVTARETANTYIRQQRFTFRSKLP